jgi:hypothetical protein
MKYSFHPAARIELNESVDYYEERRDGLGTEFLKEIYYTIQNILKYPNAWSILSRNTRRCLTKRFPYGVIYQIKEDEVIIIAIMQLNRKPGYWANRIKK